MRSKNQLRNCVGYGIRLLNKVFPGGWAHLIELDRLDMARGDTCILAQLYGAYSIGFGAVARRTWLPNCYGDYIMKRAGLWSGNDDENAVLTEEWRRAIVALRRHGG